MITTEEKWIIKETETKMDLKRIFNELTSSMIEYYDKNYLTKKQVKDDIQEAWTLTMIKAREIDEKIIKKEVNQGNKIIENNQISRAGSSDPIQEEKKSALEKEIKELKEELQKERIKIEKADIAYLKMHQKLMKLENSHNSRGAGRKPKITPEQKTMIQMYRAQGKTLQDISYIMQISYGNVQKYSKL